MKYNTVSNWPIKIYGFSTGHLPIHVNSTIITKKIHVNNLLIG